MSSRSAITFRIVAGDRPRICRRAIAREPTGSAVRTYSAMTATSTSRLRLSRVGITIAAISYTAKTSASLPRSALSDWWCTPSAGFAGATCFGGRFGRGAEPPSELLADGDDGPPIVHSLEPERKVIGGPELLTVPRHDDVLPPAPRLGVIAGHADRIDLQNHPVAPRLREDLAMSR